MGSSRTGVGETLKKKARITPEAVGGAVVGGVAGGPAGAAAGFAAGQEVGKKRIKKRIKERATLMGASDDKIAEAENIKERARQSVLEQKKRARKQTTFAGADIRRNLFQRLLGGDRASVLG